MNYFEILIAPSDYYNIFKSEIADFTLESTEEIIYNGNLSIIIRTSKDEAFIKSLLVYLQNLCDRLSEINGKSVLFIHTITAKRNENWIKVYQDSVQPISCASFTILPPWFEKAKDSTIDIILTPSLAFGTGRHATTSMRINALQSCLQDGMEVLDVGCGRGLALCANKLDANVSLCDIDELAIAEAQNNFSNNNAIIKNIIVSMLIDIHDSLAACMKSSVIIISGIIDKYRDSVVWAFKDLKLVD